MTQYYIELMDGTQPEVPNGAKVVDRGHSIQVVRLCRCENCGDDHYETLYSWPKDDIRRASVTNGSMGMDFVTPK